MKLNLTSTQKPALTKLSIKLSVFHLINKIWYS